MIGLLNQVTKETLEDDYWGDLITNVGPFVITEKGIFTDYFGAEFFLSYGQYPDYEKPRRVVRGTTNQTDRDHGSKYDDEGKIKKKFLCTTVCDLYDKEGKINKNINLFDMRGFGDFEEEFIEAVEYVKKNIQTKGADDGTNRN